MAAPSEFNIRVLCRFRPLNDSESKAGSASVVKFPAGRDDSVLVSGKVYVFDKVFSPCANQEKVYDEAAREIVIDILNGYNGTIFAYGQTSSGKTHTMEGSLEDESQQGIIPRIVSDIFNHIYSMDTNLQFQIKISYFEIYMDKIRDLLDPTKVNLPVHEDKNRVPYVKGCTERFVASPEEVLCAIEEGKANRHIAVTNMNEHSSRSHSVFLIDVKQENLETDKKLTGKLYLVDLAGSEKVSKTGAEGSVLDEAKNINRSLSALGNVIAALADGTKSHVPYRDSKLTRILQESLGGNARTTVIICCSPAAFNECETKSTLYFGQRAKMIKNTVVVNEELTAEEWKRRYDREHERVVRLRGQLAAAEREILQWRSGQSVNQGEMVVLRYADRSSPSEDDMETSGVDQFGDGKSYPTMLNNTSRYGSCDYSGTSITDDERVLLVEKRCNSLYRQLDEKDEEITQLEQQLNALREQQADQEEHIAQLRRANETIKAEQASVRSENDKSKEEVKELLHALEELALSYEQKTGDLKAKISQDSEIIKEHDRVVNQLESLRDELSSFKQCVGYQHKYLTKTFAEVVGELSDLVGVSADQFADGQTDSKEFKGTDLSFDRELSYCKLMIARLKVEVKSLRQRIDQLNDQLTLANSTIDTQKSRIEEYNQITRELNARVASLNEAKEEAETHLKSLQQLARSCNESLGDKDINSVAELVQQELEEKRKIIDDLRERLSVVSATNESLSEECTKLKSSLSEKCSELDSYRQEKEKEEKAFEELRVLEHTVAKELQTLHKARRLFVRDLQNRIRCNHMGNSAAKMEDSLGRNDSVVKQNDSSISELFPCKPAADQSEMTINDGCGSIVQKQKIEYLEDSLKQLTRVYKELVKENADLHCEIPKLEKRLKATYERLRNLESALKEAKESATKDRKKYMTEVNRIKEAVRLRNFTRRGNTPQIVKTIKAGQLPSITGKLQSCG